ncbi:MAG: acyl-CoA dehydrogenase family protein, partial [Dehalococcoidia bacterium]|nr:acyl-CoA dehydrogenase family protein [Dehalococcoidia bacterium]
MEFGWAPEFEAFREEVKQFVGEQLTPELQAEIANADREETTRGPLVGKVQEAIKARGWLTMCWPPELGGQGKSPWFQHVLQEELQKAGIPYRGIPWMAPAIERFGTEEQKKRYLPGLWSGEMTCALGYSEPNAGTDLASLETVATRDGDDWVINGQKLWTTGAHHSSHIWLAARSDPKAPKHRGISMFILPLNSQGITVRPVYTMGDLRTNEVFFENVRVPGYGLIGEEGRGWYVAANALDVERVSLGGGVGQRRAYERMLSYLKEQRPALLSDRAVRLRLAEIKVDLHNQRAISMKNASIVASGATPTMEASMAKIVNSELAYRMDSLAMDIAGRAGILSKGSEGAAYEGEFEQSYRASPVGRFGGGTNEVQRNIIAQRG